MIDFKNSKYIDDEYVCGETFHPAYGDSSGDDLYQIVDFDEKYLTIKIPTSRKLKINEIKNLFSLCREYTHSILPNYNGKLKDYEF